MRCKKVVSVVAGITSVIVLFLGPASGTVWGPGTALENVAIHPVIPKGQHTTRPHRPLACEVVWCRRGLWRYALDGRRRTSGDVFSIRYRTIIFTGAGTPLPVKKQKNV